MFRQQQNAFDEAVNKATDENLTSENWEYILDVCDKVGSSDTGAKDAVAAMIKRLAHRNANVQLYTLELANALSQNCGKKMHQELASRSFTEAIIRLANDRNTHQQVKAKIAERMGEWTEMFSKDPDLGIMEQAYMRLKTQNPNIRPPSKPQKTQITDSDRQKEEEELQMALALSVKESADKAKKAEAKPSSGQEAASSTSNQPTPQPKPAGSTAATVSRVRALFDFQPSEPDELQFRKGDVIAVVKSEYKDWWRGSLRGQTGIFPLNYVEKLRDPTTEELEQEAQMEAEVFAQIHNVDKLQRLLFAKSRPGEGDVREDEEITELYHSTLSIRPKLIELIGKYSQKKDDFTQLNERFIKARRDYESLMDASLSQPPQSAYSQQQRPYSYAPQSQAGYPPYGAPDQRYYTPGPAAEPGYPPQSTPTPHYMVPAGTYPSQQQHQGQSPKPSHPDPYSSGPSAPPSTSGAPPPHQHAGPQGPSQTMPQRLPVGQGPPGSQRPHSVAYGAPQELSTAHYDSPVDARAGAGYPPPSQAPPGPPGTWHGGAPAGSAGYDPYGAPPQQQQPPPQQQQHQQQAPPQHYQQHQPPQSQPPPQHQQPPSHPHAPHVQHQDSFDSPTSLYSQATLQGQQPQQPPPGPPGSQGPPGQQAQPGYPSQPSHSPPAIPTSPPPMGGPPASYQAYQPPGPQAPPGGGQGWGGQPGGQGQGQQGGGGGGDEGFYR